jgi:hypothetical protein
MSNGSSRADIIAGTPEAPRTLLSISEQMIGEPDNLARADQGLLSRMSNLTK